MTTSTSYVGVSAPAYATLTVPSSANVRRSKRPGSNRASEGLFATTPTLWPGTPSRISRSAIAWFTVTARRASAIEIRSLHSEQAVDDRVRGAREARPEELRHRLVEVEQDRDADEPERQAGEREQVRRGVDLDQRVAPPRIRPGQGPRRPDEEREVLEQVRPEARALVAPDVEAVDGHAVEDAVRRVAIAPQAEDVDRAARRDERLRLAADARILVVVGVDEHGHRPAPCGGLRRRAQPPLQPAPSRSTWRGRTSRPPELLTVSTTRSARA